MNDDEDHCPKCNADFRGEPIPEKYREHFGGRTHFSRRIAITDQRRDRCVAYRCPDCGAEWARE